VGLASEGKEFLHALNDSLRLDLILLIERHTIKLTSLIRIFLIIVILWHPSWKKFAPLREKRKVIKNIHANTIRTK